jgi:hypothetical protein
MACEFILNLHRIEKRAQLCRPRRSIVVSICSSKEEGLQLAVTGSWRGITSLREPFETMIDGYSARSTMLDFANDLEDNLQKWRDDGTLYHKARCARCVWRAREAKQWQQSFELPGHKVTV